MTLRIAPCGNQPRRIAMWSGPRNISTAMMRSFSSRNDTAVTDEPFYGAYLQLTGERHAMADEIIADMDTDWHSVARTMSGEIPGGKQVWYQKHMTHHMEGSVGIDDLTGHTHAFLIRHPALMVASYRQKNELVEARQLGFGRLVEYHKRASDRAGHAAPVIDSNAVLADPESMLSALCHALGIDWQPAMLRWAKGAHPDDGIWGSHWYNAVWNSEGFGSPTAPSVLSDDERRIADECRESYDYLLKFALHVKAAV